jgi:oligosaccharide translocation protein RFT1
MEESARLYFSSTAFNEKCSGRSSRQALLVLNNLVRFSVILFIIALAFVSPTIPLLVDVILPERYRTTSAATTLVVYLSIYLPIISLNGILEAFFAATTGTQDIAAQSGVLAACSAIFGVTLLFLRTFRAVKTSNETRMIAQTKISWINPETSLVFANAAQMLCRVAYASKHARGVASRTKQADRTRPFIFCLTPGRLTLFTATVAAVICRIYPVCFGPLQQIAVTAAMGVCCVGAM